MSYPLITKAGVDAAEPLDFPDRKIVISTQVQYRGRVWTVSFEGYTVDQAADLVERRFGGNTPPAPADGAPVCHNANCSRFGKPLAPSQHGEGYFCKGKDDRTGNSKGYCKTTA